MSPLAQAAQAKAAAAQLAQQQSAEAAYQAQLPGYEQTLANDLNTGNYAGAWQFATTHGDNANISQAQRSANNAANIYAKSYDPLTAIMETSAGLKSLDPNKQWSQQDVTNFYNAANPYWHQDAQVSNGQIANSGLGENPYRNTTGKGTEWGTNANLTQDAATNYKMAPGSAPDLARFAGQSATDPSFLQKYGAPIAAIALACVAPEAIGALAPMLGGGVLGGAAAGALVGAGSSAAIDEISGQPLTLKSAGIGAAGGALGGSGLLSSLNSGVGNVVSDAAGNVVSEGAADTIGNIAGDAVAGAAKGAIMGSLTGKARNAGIGALVGGVGSGIASGVGELGDAAGANNTLTSAVGKAAGTAGTNELTGKTTNGAGLAENAALGVAGSAALGAITGDGNATEGSGVAGQQSNTTPEGNTMSDNSDGLSYLDASGNDISETMYDEQNGINPLGTPSFTPAEVQDPNGPNGPGGSSDSSGSSGSSGQIPGLSSLLKTLGLGGTNLSTVGGLAGLAALIGKATGQTNSTSTQFNPPPLFGSTLGNTGAPGSVSASNPYHGPPQTQQVSPNVNYATYGETGHTPSQSFFQPQGGYSNNGMVAGTQTAGSPVNTSAGAPNGLVGNGSLPPGLLQTMQALNTQGNTPATSQPSMYRQPPMQQPGYGGGWGQQPYGPGNGLQPGAGMQAGPWLNNPGNNGGVTLPASGINSWQVQHHASGGYISNVTDDDNHYASGGQTSASQTSNTGQTSASQTSGTGPGYQPLPAYTGTSVAHGISVTPNIQPLAKWQLHQGYAQGGVAGSADGQPDQSQTTQLNGQLTNSSLNGTHSQPLGGGSQTGLGPMEGLAGLFSGSPGNATYSSGPLSGGPLSGLGGYLQHQSGAPMQSQAGLAGLFGGAGRMGGWGAPAGSQIQGDPLPLDPVSGGGNVPAPTASPSQVSQQVQQSPNTTNPNPMPVQSTANSAPQSSQSSMASSTTPALQQVNPQQSIPNLQSSVPRPAQPGTTAPSVRQSFTMPSVRMGNQQQPNGDGTRPWQTPASGWNQQHGGSRFADGGHMQEVHEQGALGSMIPDMSNPPDHMGNSRPHYTGNMTQSSGRADDINAKLANNEYIIDAETTALAGDGNPDEGARRFDKLREEIRKHKGKKLAKGKISPNAKPRLSAYNPEVVR